MSPIANAAECTTSTAASNGYRYVAFKTVGECGWTVPAGVVAIEVVIVAGGGGGGGNAWNGGGGAGGVVYDNNYAVTAGASLPIKVGDGGAGGVNTTGSTTIGSRGADSWIGTLGFAAKGGGGGGGYGWQFNPTWATGSNGGSSGGHGETGSTLGAVAPTQSTPSGATTSHGNAGGALSFTAGSQAGTGGGGAGGVGGSVSAFREPGSGGSGINTYSALTTPVLVGVSGYIAGGGGGGSITGASGGAGGGGRGGDDNSTSPVAGTANTGGGGGGACQHAGAKGGSGVVVLRYLLAPGTNGGPNGTSVNAGSSYTFSIDAYIQDSVGALTYVWKKGASVISGQNANSYTISSVLVADSATYSVTVTNTLGTVTSNITSSASISVNQSSSNPIVNYANSNVLTYSSGGTFSPTSIIHNGTGALKFYVNDTGICTINISTAVITTVAPGQCRVYMTDDGDSSFYVGTSYTYVTINKGSSTAALTYTGVTYSVSGTISPASNTQTGDGTPITYTSDTASICSVNGSGVITIITAGTCQITKTVPDGTNFAGTSVTGSAVISRANRTLAITNTAATVPYLGTVALTSATSPAGTGGSTTYSVGASTACTVSGDVLTMNLSSGTCSVSASITAGTSYNSANTTSSVSFTPSKTTPSGSLSYSDQVFVLNSTSSPTFSTSSDGTVSYSTSSASSICTLNTSTGVVTAKGPGDCVVTVTVASSSNYESVTSSDTLTLRIPKPTFTIARGTSQYSLKVDFAEATGAASYTLKMYRSTDTTNTSWSATAFDTIANYTPGTTIEGSNPGVCSGGNLCFQLASGYSFKFTLEVIAASGYTSDGVSSLTAAYGTMQECAPSLDSQGLYGSSGLRVFLYMTNCGIAVSARSSLTLRVYSSTDSYASPVQTITSFPTSGQFVELTGGLSYKFTFQHFGGTAGGVTWLDSLETRLVQSTNPYIFIKPAAPTNLVVTSGDRALSLSWTGSSSANNGYYIQYSSDGANWSSGGTSSGTIISITGLTNGTNYYLQVYTGGTSPNSRYSDALTGSTTYKPFSTPDAVATGGGSPGDGVYGLTWTAPASNGGSAVTGYVIQYSTDNSNWTEATVANTVFSYSITGITNGTNYFVRLGAQNAGGIGAWTNFGSPTVKPYGVPVLTLGAATSVTTTTATIAASLDAKGVSTTPSLVYKDPDGTVHTFAQSATSAASNSYSQNLTGLQPGTRYEFYATYTDGTGITSKFFNTTPLPVSNLSAVKGTNQITASWDAYASSTGIQFFYTVWATNGGSTVGTGCNSVSAISSGRSSCTITGLTSGVSYTINVTATVELGDFGNGTSTAATITASPKSAQSPLTLTTISTTYGTTLALAVTGGSTAGALSYSATTGTASACSLVGANLDASKLGTCLVTVTMAGDTDYASVSTSQTTVTIGKAPLTVTVANKSKNYLVSTPTFTASISGLKYVDAASVAVNSATFTAGDFYNSTTAPAHAETYTVTVGAGNVTFTFTSPATINNYEVSYVSGTYVINPIDQTGPFSLPSTSVEYNGGSGITFSPTGQPLSAVTPTLTRNTADSAICYVNNQTFAPITYGTCRISIVSSGVVVSGGHRYQSYNSYTSSEIEVSITRKAITLTGISATNRGYNGQTAVVLSGTPSLSGVITGDISNVTITGTASGSIASANAGNSKSVSVSGLSLSGSKSSNYTLSTFSTTVDIAKVSLTIASDSKIKVYGASDPTWSAAITGFVNSESATISDTSFTFAGTGGTSYSSSATAPSNIGSYLITPSGATTTFSSGSIDNYNISYATGMYSISTSPRTVTIAAKTKVYGGSDPSLTYTLDTPLAGADSAEATWSRASGDSVGNYLLSLSLANSNYAFTYTGAALSITKATLTATASSPSVTYGASTPTINVSYSGFVNSENATSTAFTTGLVAPTCSSTYTITTAATTNVVTSCTGASATNYDFSYVNGAFVVGKATQTITFAIPSDRGFSATSFNLAPTASSGFTPTLTSNDALKCTVVGLAVTMVSQGTCSLTASQIGDSNYHAAIAVTRTFEINGKADPVLLAFSDVSKRKGDVVFDLSLPNSSVPGIFTFSSGSTSVATITNDKVTVVAPGTSLITATFTPTDVANYNIVSITMTLTVSKAVQATLSVEGAATTAITGSSIGLTTSGGSGVGVITLVIVSGNCVITDTNVSSATEGRCEIKVKKGTDADFEEANSSNIVLTFTSPAPAPTPAPTGGGGGSPVSVALLAPVVPVVPPKPEVMSPPSTPMQINGANPSHTPGTSAVTLAGIVATSQGEVISGVTYSLSSSAINLQVKSLDALNQNISTSVVNSLVFETTGTSNFLGSGYKPRTTIFVWIFSTATLLGETTADASGYFNTSFNLPTSVAAGNHTLQVNAVTTDGKVISQMIGIQVRTPVVEVTQSLSDISARVQGNEIVVTWSGNDSASTVKVQSSNQVVREISVEKGVFIATISNLESGLAYSITVTPIGKTDSNSAKSVVVSLPPSVPSNLQVSQIGTSNIRVSWTNVSPSFQYRVAVITAGEPVRTVVTNKSSVEIDVKPGSEYQVLLVAIGAGESISGVAESKIKVAMMPVAIKTNVSMFSVYFGSKKYLPNRDIQKTLNQNISKIRPASKLICIAYVSATKFKSMAVGIAKKQSVNTCSYLAKGKRLKSVSAIYKMLSAAPKGKAIPKGFTRVDVVITN